MTEHGSQESMQRLIERFNGARERLGALALTSAQDQQLQRVYSELRRVEIINDLPFYKHPDEPGKEWTEAEPRMKELSPRDFNNLITEAETFSQ